MGALQKPKFSFSVRGSTPKSSLTKKILLGEWKSVPQQKRKPWECSKAKKFSFWTRGSAPKASLTKSERLGDEILAQEQKSKAPK